MIKFSEIKKSIIICLWFVFLTFPIMVIRVNPTEKIIEWRWHRMIIIAALFFALSYLWRYLLKKKESKSETEIEGAEGKHGFSLNAILYNKKYGIPALAILAVFMMVFPFIFSTYQTNIVISAMIYVVLGLGLSIVVGLAGLLVLGYVAFYAVGAYAYALLNHHFGIGFWTALPIGAVLGAVFGILVGFPVLRLKGDYLAIVTLAFGEIIRLVLENWNDFSFGPSGISNIARPSLFGMKMSVSGATTYVFYIMIILCIVTIIAVRRLKDSRVGRALMALREDEIACEAMGINKAKTKLFAFAFGAMWAGMAGVIFAAKTTFINPASFTIWESILILCIVVLGGMSSIVGVIIGALIISLLPEYLRVFSEYRMLVFGLMLVVMMLFRPGGIVGEVRRIYRFKTEGRDNAAGSVQQ